MNKFNILVCEDEKKDQIDIELFILAVKRDLPKVEISFEIVDFSKIFENLEKEFDILILDLSDNHNNSSGDNVIMHNDGKKKIPTLIYTSTGDKIAFDFDSTKLKYPFLIKKLVKIPNDGSNLKQFLKGYIITVTENKHYKLYNSSDSYLQLAIDYIGKRNFNHILYSIFEKYGREITVEPMTSGWSGAVLFKLIIGSDGYILKLSKDIDSLSDEQNKSKEFYESFPDQLTTSIKQDNYYSFDKSVFGFMIKSIENSTTLLSHVLENEDASSITNPLIELYSSENSLRNHYETRVQKPEKKDWTAIFEKINKRKIQWIKQNYNSFEPIVTKFYKEISINNFENICIHGNFKNLNKTELLDDLFKKYLVLSHGDLHANNILIQGERPFIIDTGALGYQHWAIDISRLITSIFIRGLDNNTISYYDLNRTEYYLDIGKKIISKENISIIDGDNNKNSLTAINWLLDNIDNIYGTQFSLFEYQLALMKEFLQLSYKSETIPPNKRALALILADICLLKANENVKQPV